MAEQVQLHLESRLPELDDLIKKGIFSEERVKNIVAHRTKYEYRLKRRGAILEDFLLYIEFEKKLEVERLDRIKELGIKSKHTLSNHSIVQHIFGLYQRALVKFGGDVSLWIQFLEYAILQESRQVFSKSISRALQLHPLHFPLWIMAAQWEWKFQGNMRAARLLLQKSLRLNSKCVETWKAFFDLEVEFVKKVLERRNLLGLENSEESTVDEDGNVLKGALVIAIYDQCLVEAPELSPADACYFLISSCALQSLLPWVSTHIWDDILSRFQSKPEYLNVLVSELFSSNPTPETLAKSLKILDDALSHNFSPEMLKFSVDFLLSVPHLVDSSEFDPVKMAILDKLDQLFQLAEEQKMLPSSLAIEWIKLAPEMGYSETSLIELKEKVFSSYPNSEDLRVLSLEDMIEKVSDWEGVREISSKLDKVSDKNIQRNLLNNILVKWSELYYLGSSKKGRKVLLHLASKNYIEFGHASFDSALEQLFACDGIKCVREFCREVLDKRSVTAKFFISWIKAEMLSDSFDVIFIRNLYRKALILNQQDALIWKEFILFEKTQRNYSEAAKIWDQAKNVVSDVKLLSC